MKRFGEKVQTLRKRKKMSLVELSRQLGHADHSFMSRIESGQKEPSANLVMNLAKILDTTTDQLLFDHLDV